MTNLKETKPQLFSLKELAAQKKASATHVLLFITQEEWNIATKGLKTETGPIVPGRGLMVIPIPGQGGYVGIPVCGPRENPYLAPGGWKCLPTDFWEPNDPKDPIDTQRPPCGGSFVVDGSRAVGCSGTCQPGYRCTRRLVQVSNGWIFLGCECVPKSMQERVREAGVGIGTPDPR